MGGLYLALSCLFVLHSGLLVRKTFLAFRQQVGVQIFHKDLNNCLSATVSATVYPNFVVNRLKLKNLM